jgi:hypothetical protein
MASDTFAVIDEETIVWHVRSSLLQHQRCRQRSVGSARVEFGRFWYAEKLWLIL